MGGLQNNYQNIEHSTQDSRMQHREAVSDTPISDQLQPELIDQVFRDRLAHFEDPFDTPPKDTYCPGFLRKWTTRDEMTNKKGVPIIGPIFETRGRDQQKVGHSAYHSLPDPDLKLRQTMELGER